MSLFFYLSSKVWNTINYAKLSGSPNKSLPLRCVARAFAYRAYPPRNPRMWRAAVLGLMGGIAHDNKLWKCKRRLHRPLPPSCSFRLYLSSLSSPLSMIRVLRRPSARGPSISASSPSAKQRVDKNTWSPTMRDPRRALRAQEGVISGRCGGGGWAETRMEIDKGAGTLLNDYGCKKWGKEL